MKPAPVLRTTLAVLLGAWLLAGRFPNPGAWGLDVPAFLAPAIAAGLGVVALAGIIPPAARRLGGAWDRALDRMPLPWWAGYAVAGALGFLVVAWLPDRVWFLGDFQLRQGTVAIGDPFERAFPQSLPLDSFLHFVIPRGLGARSIVSVNFIARMIGALEAGGLAIVATRFARGFSARPVVRLAVGATVFFGGYLTVFTGFGKSASELCLLTAAAGMLAIRVIRKRGGEVWLGILTAVALMLHRSAMLLLPPTLFVLALAWKRDAGRPRRRASGLALIVLLVALAMMAPRLAAVLRNFDLIHHLLPATGGRWLDLVTPRRLADLVNLVVILSPLSLGLPVLLFALDPGDRRSDELRALSLLAIPWVVAMLVIRPQQGIFRDWDVFAPAGVAGSLLTAWCLGRVLPKIRDGAALAAGVTLLVSTFALAWLIHFHDPARGLARIHAHAGALDRSAVSGEAGRENGKVWEFLGFRHAELGEWDLAADAFARAVVRAPHRYLYVAWGLAELHHRDLEGSESAFRALTMRFPDYSLGWFGLAGVSTQRRDTLEVAHALRRLGATLDTDAEAREIRGLRRRYPEVWPGDFEPVALRSRPISVDR